MTTKSLPILPQTSAMTATVYTYYLVRRLNLFLPVKGLMPGEQTIIATLGNKPAFAILQATDYFKENGFVHRVRGLPGFGSRSDCIEWLLANLKHPGGTNKSRSFFFTSEDDAALFKLVFG